MNNSLEKIVKAAELSKSRLNKEINKISRQVNEMTFLKEIYPAAQEGKTSAEIGLNFFWDDCMPENETIFLYNKMKEILSNLKIKRIIKTYTFSNAEVGMGQSKICAATVYVIFDPQTIIKEAEKYTISKMTPATDWLPIGKTRFEYSESKVRLKYKGNQIKTPPRIARLAQLFLSDPHSRIGFESINVCSTASHSKAENKLDAKRAASKYVSELKKMFKRETGNAMIAKCKGETAWIYQA